MQNGTIKWFKSDKNYGFITSESGDDIFVHRGGLSGPAWTPRTGDKVTFETQQADRGPKAVNVRVVE